MPLTDLTLPELVDFRPQVPEPADFDAFWAQTLAESAAIPPRLERRRIEGPITQVIVEDVEFAGYAGDPIKAWIIRPLDERPRPAVVEFIGYNGGRGLPAEHLHWAAAGYVNVIMDTRGQGSGWGGGGSTSDPHGSGAALDGYMTRGIEDPHDYFYRRVFVDAVRLVEAVQTLEFVDPQQVAITGGSQGGGITLAVAGLVGSRVAGVMPDVPFLCHFRRAVSLTPSRPFTEVTQYLSIHRGSTEQVFTTLSYFDGANFARRATAPALFSVGLMDDIVLPSTVFAAYNGYGSSDREIAVYEFNGHEGGQFYHWQRQEAWLAARR
ncbi:cephalosporin-C deacetylase [Propionicimonas paludicola]|uniref:Cephalosporin-C deacetylase n=1 Tax=Propionicimonas paludicola TaxID=185243 RepID=A0A2A9CP74_9ACTN|nr:acetylxylan esterase [Propionicimonas paludicola]PFG15885.1 cephalosporin-C deacetylase [Propionicimonas paludicola]